MPYMCSFKRLQGWCRAPVLEYDPLTCVFIRSDALLKIPTFLYGHLYKQVGDRLGKYSVTVSWKIRFCLQCWQFLVRALFGQGGKEDGNPNPDTNTGKNSTLYQHSAISCSKLFYHNSLLMQPRNDSVVVCLTSISYRLFFSPKPHDLFKRSSEQGKCRKCYLLWSA